MRIGKIIAEVLREAHRRQAEETMEVLAEKSEEFYKISG